MQAQGNLPGSVTEFPTSNVTRAEAAMVLLLSRMREVPVTKNDGRFADVPAGSWHERFVFAAEKYGIIKPDPFGKIRPDREVNRAEFLKMMALAFGLPLGLPHAYTDIPRGSWYEPYVGFAYRYRIFRTNLEAPRLAPGHPLSHKEAADAIQRLFDVRGKNFPLLTVLAEARHMAAPRLALTLRISQKLEEVTMTAQAEPPPPPPAPPKQELTFEDVLDSRRLKELQGRFLLAVNTQRGENGLPPLRSEPSLTRSAQRYAEEMSQQNSFGHVSPSGQTLKDRIEGSGYFGPFLQSDCRCQRRYIIGENLARGQRTVTETINAWMASESHRSAILHKDFLEVGFGVSAGYWVLHFAGVVEEKRP